MIVHVYKHKKNVLNQFVSKKYNFIIIIKLYTMVLV